MPGKSKPTYSALAKYLVEFLGTFLLVLTVIKVAKSSIDYGPYIIFAVLCFIVYFGGPISRAHFNPSSTITFIGRGGIDRREIAGYFLAIISGGLLAAILGSTIIDESRDSSFHPLWHWLALSEFLGTFALMWVIMYVATLKKTAGNMYYGIAIAGTVLVGIWTFSTVGRALFNPIVSVACWINGFIDGAEAILSIGAQLLAASISVLTFNWCYGTEAT